MPWRDQLALLLGAASPFGLIAADGQAAEPVHWLDGPRADPPEVQKDLLLFRDPAERERLLLFAGHRSHSSHSSHRSHYSSSGGGHSSHSSHYSGSGGYAVPAPVYRAPAVSAPKPKKVTPKVQVRPGDTSPVIVKPFTASPHHRPALPDHQPGQDAENAGQDVLKRQKLSPDEIRDMVQKVQVALVVRGFDPGPLTGELNDRTRIALGRFQAAQALPISGLMDLRTLRALGVEIAMSSSPPSPKPTSTLAAGGPGALALIDQPNWTALPGADFILTFYPGAARKAGVDGSAALVCDVTEAGELHSCRIETEVPPGHGFGQAALRLASFFRLNPLDLDGQPVGGKGVRLKIDFKRPPPQPTSVTETESDQPTARSLGPIDQPHWAGQPGDDFIAAFYPDRARNSRVGGVVVLACVSTDAGELSTCQIESETPVGYDLGSAALKLAPFFRLRPLDESGRPVSGRSVRVAINFKKPA